jgi:sec-independent protein translocase protein TatB
LPRLRLEVYVKHMFNLGFTEMLLLAAIALIVIGPKQLPDMARMLGRMINEFRRATSEFTSTIDDFKFKTRSYVEDTEKQLTQVAKKAVEEDKEPDAEESESSNSIKATDDNGDGSGKA